MHQRNEKVRLCRFSDFVRLAIQENSGFILDIKGGKYYKLNLSATRICQAMLQDTDLRTLAGELKNIGDKYCADIESDIAAFLRRLEEVGLCHIWEASQLSS